MKSMIASCLFFYFSVFVVGCQTKQTSSSEAQKNAAIDSAKTVAQKVLAYSDSLDFKTALKFFTDDSDGRFVENGYLYPSLQAVKDSYNQIAPTIQRLHTMVDNWSGVLALDDSAVLLTLPLHFTIQAKGRPEYKGQYVMSLVVQKRHGRWTVIQTHESWLNYAKAIAAITPPPANSK
jgi:SnoaL-like domain